MATMESIQQPIPPIINGLNLKMIPDRKMGIP